MEEKWPAFDRTTVAHNAAVLCLVLVIFVPLVIGANALAQAAGRTLGTPIRPYEMVVLILSFRLAEWIVYLILKRKGSVREARTVEVWHRPVPGTEPEIIEQERVEVHAKPGTLPLLGLFSLVLFLACGAYLLLRADNATRWLLGLAGVGLFGAGFVGSFHSLARGMPHAWADASGITGHPSRFGFRPRFVPWSSIDSCAIETYHDPEGKPLALLMTLRSPAGQGLLTMSFGGLAEAPAPPVNSLDFLPRTGDPAPLLKAIKARLTVAASGLDDL